jgi:phosphoribosyl-ATP pyrophosphohydrolase/phosphoribosyl-AMP cyclohydrolase
MQELNFEKGNGLVPAIIQDYKTRKVLMLGYMNRESYEKTRETGLVTFYSRSRESIWTKGETSGNYLHVKDMMLDCDQDTLLVMVSPDGPVCHTGKDTCFDQENIPGIDFIDHLQAVINDRKARMPEGSYTTKLFQKGTGRIAQKVGEEAVETVIGALGDDDDSFLNEAADLVYHLLVLLAQKGYDIKDVARILSERHK